MITNPHFGQIGKNWQNLLEIQSFGQKILASSFVEWRLLKIVIFQKMEIFQEKKEDVEKMELFTKNRDFLDKIYFFVRKWRFFRKNGDFLKKQSF